MTSEREVLDSEAISSDESPDDVLSALTRSIEGNTATLSGVEPAKLEVYNTGNPADRSGEVIHDRYRLLQMLGKGGMGTVYLAQHVALARTFAVKLLNPRYAARADIAERFLLEAKAVSKIEHDNVVGVTDFGTTADGSAFLVMEHLRGESLGALCKREAPLPWPRVRHIMLQLCRALQAAHDAGVVHRDIKLDNVLRTERGGDRDFIKVLDFGLAKLQTGGGLRLTRTGMVLGTPDYMSPEQARGASTDHRTDIYAAGVVMYLLLCGHAPFRANNFMGMRNQHLLVVPERPSARAPEAGITDEMDAVVLRALAKDPRNRFESMQQMAAAILDVGTGVGPVALLEAGDTYEDDDPLSVELVGGVSGLVERSSKLGHSGRVTSQARVGHPRAAPSTTASAKAPVKRRAWLLLVTAGVAIAAGVATVFVVGPDRGGEQQPTPAPARPAAEPELREPEPIVSVSAPIEPVAQTVVLQFRTNVPVRVLEARDQAMFARGALVDRIEVPRSDTSLQLILRADGYRDHELSVTPDRDQSLDVELEPAPVAEPKPGERKVVSSPPTPVEEPEPTEAPESKPTDNSFAPGIVNPWEAKRQSGSPSG